MKIIAKAAVAKEKVCRTCAFRKRCGDLSGFCILIYNIPIVLIVVMLLYLLLTMSL